MMHHAPRALLSALVVAASTVALGACVVSSPAPAVYGQYGYATVQAPNTVYYQGGNFGGVYYRPGYYARTAPFIAQPTYVQPQPVYYQRPGVVVNGNVGVPYGGVQGSVIVR